jgi:hypothetical protein
MSSDDDVKIPAHITTISGGLSFDDEQSLKSSRSSDARCKVFISYSHKDTAFRDRLETQLVHLKDRGYVDFWSDNQIKASGDWSSNINSAMEAANVFLLLVSPDFVASDFIMGKEVPYATERARAGTAQVVSIIVRAVHWAELPRLNQFQALPTGMRPVKNWNDPDEAWLDVEKGIIEAIKIFSGDLIDTFVTMAEPALRAMRAYESDTSSLSTFEGEAPKKYHAITDFWKGDIDDGRLVTMKGTVSRYAPMVIGSPFKKRDAHLAFRKKLSETSKSPESDEAKLNALLAFSAGQMAWSVNFPGAGFRFFGLYQSIVRNSIPLFVKEEYYKNILEHMFEERGKTFDARVIGRVRLLPKDFTALFSDAKLIGTQIVKPKLTEDDRPIYGIFVDDEATSITYHERTTYLDGDIWVAIRTPKTGTQIYSRFCNLADETDIAGQVHDLKLELDKIPSYNVVFQFDQLDKRFDGKQMLESDDIFGITFKRQKRWWHVGWK